MCGETRRACAGGPQRGVACAIKEKRGREEQEKRCIEPGEVAAFGCRRLGDVEIVEQGRGFASSELAAAAAP